MRDDVDDGALSRAAEFGGKRSREDLERVDRPRIDHFAEVRRGREWERYAVDLVREPVESVSDRFVIREVNDSGERFDHAVEALIVRQRGELLATDRVDGDGRRARALHEPRVRATDFFEVEIERERDDGVALHGDDLRGVGRTRSMRDERVTPERDATEDERSVRERYGT
jgi:hypothetical protein